MKPFKKILVPVDFSACSEEAVRTAADVAQRYDADIVLVNVFEPVLYSTPEGMPFLAPGQLEDLLAANASVLGNARKSAEAAGARRVETQELQGGAVHEVAEFARTGHFDLIVMGTHGRTGIRHALLGSVAEQLVRKAPCPVLCVRAAEQPT